MRPIAYLVSDFGAPSHTFVRREVAALRALGRIIIPFTIRRSSAAGGGAVPLIGRSPLAYLAALGRLLITRPHRLAAGWWLACRHRAPGPRALIWSQFHFVEAVLLAHLLRVAGAVRLHVHFANSGATVGMIAAEIADLPWSLTLHGISETDYPAGLLLGGKIERADFVACASYFMRAQAMRLVASDHWPKMHIVRCGIDLAALPAPKAATCGEAGPAAQLICVGRLSAEKGYDGLLEALAKLPASDGAAFELSIVGGGSPQRKLESRAASLALGDRVRFVGALTETETLERIAQADILVLPSLMEGLPVVLIEAAALGKPVIASRVAGIPELVEDGRSGYLFAPSDWEALAEAIARMLAGRADWARMGQRGRARVEAGFRVEHAAAQMAALFGGEVS